MNSVLMNSRPHTSVLAFAPAQIAGGAALLVLAGILLAVLIFVVAAVVSILGSRQYSFPGKLLWIIGVFAFPVFGSAAWFAIGRKLVLAQR